MEKVFLARKHKNKNMKMHSAFQKKNLESEIKCLLFRIRENNQTVHNIFNC